MIDELLLRQPLSETFPPAAPPFSASQLCKMIEGITTLIGAKTNKLKLRVTPLGAVAQELLRPAHTDCGTWLIPRCTKAFMYWIVLGSEMFMGSV